MKKKGLALLIGISMALVVVVTVGVFVGGTEDTRIERLKTQQVPTDGAVLFDFLLREIPRRGIAGAVCLLQRGAGGLLSGRVPAFVTTLRCDIPPEKRRCLSGLL